MSMSGKCDSIHTPYSFSRLDKFDAIRSTLMRVLIINYFEKYAVGHFNFSYKLTLKYHNVNPVYVLHNNN